MDFQDEKLSLISILFISGISCLAFSGLMKLLEGDMPVIFFRIGAIAVAAASLLSLLKYVLGSIVAKKSSGKSGHSAGFGS